MSTTIKELSFEFFPPKTAQGLRNLVTTATKLNSFNPRFFSVTYGAGGSTKDRTFNTIATLIDNGINAIPHLSWGEEGEAEILQLITDYQNLGVKALVVLRGDRPSGVGHGAKLHYAAELVQLIRLKTGDFFELHVGSYPEVHPESPSPSADLDFLKKKVVAGANYCITQYFYNVDAFRHFHANCRDIGIDVPIVPGVMPITNYEQLARFSSNCGAEIPRWVLQQLAELRDQNERLIAFGVDVVASLCLRLLERDTPGLHFYTMNKFNPTSLILQRLIAE